LINKIEQREKENPNDIDEMPVQTDEVDWRAVLGRETALHRLSDQPNQQACADNHVQGVKPGHREVKREKQLRVGVGSHRGARLKVETQPWNVMLDEFFMILNALDT
jgi:hypothetical protein